MLNLSHKNLDVYKLALNLVKEVYNITQHLPKEERYLLTDQLRRAAVSVCSSIAEGAARFTKPEKKRFYEISRSSAVEIDTQLEILLTLKYLTINQIKELEECLESIFKMLSKMISNLNQ